MNTATTSRRRSTLLIALFVVTAAAAVEAQGVKPLNSSAFQRGVAGVYLGTLDFAPLGIDRREPIAFHLDILNGAIMVSEHEPTERESATIGVWENLGRGRLRIGILAFRLGDGACAIIAPPDGAADDTCILRIGATLARNGQGGLDGEIVLTFEEVDANTGETIQVITPPLPTSLEKQSFDDFPLP